MSDYKNKEEIIQSLINFRNYMYKYQDIYDEISRYAEYENKVKKEKQRAGVYCLVSFLFGMLIIIFGCIQLVLIEIGKWFGGKFEEFTRIIAPNWWFIGAVFLIGIIYWRIVTAFFALSDTRILNKYDKELKALEDAKNKAFAYYKKYEKPPLTFEYSNPKAIQSIINELKKEDCETIYMAIKRIYGEI